MKTSTQEKGAAPKETNKTGKRPYKKPVFRAYGSVTALTKGKTGTNCDGINRNSSSQIC